MTRGYVALKEKARRNQEVAAVKGDYFPGRGDLSSTWNAHEIGFKRRQNKEEVAHTLKQEVAARDAIFSALSAVFVDLDARRGYCAKRLGKRKANGR